jgi:hypothetical protein
MLNILKACVMGLLFCMFLPAVGIVLTLWAIAKHTAEWLASLTSTAEGTEPR